MTLDLNPLDAVVIPPKTPSIASLSEVGRSFMMSILSPMIRSSN
jgi:hypothetical protein